MSVVRIGVNLVLRDGIVYARIRAKRRLRWIKCPVQGPTGPGRVGAYRLEGGRPVAVKATEAWRDFEANTMGTEQWQREHAVEGKQVAPTLGRLIEVYRRIAAMRFAQCDTPRPETVRGNVAKLRMVAGGCGVSDGDGLGALAPAAVARWVQRRVEAAPEGKRARARYSAWRTVSMARSVWARWTMGEYAAAGLRVPQELQGWPLPPLGAAEAPQAGDPPEGLKRATVAAWEALERENPRLWLASVLVFQLAMRPCDARALCWGAFEQRAAGEWWLRYTPSKTRARSNRPRVVEWPLAAGIYERMRAAAGGGGADLGGLVIEGATATARHDVLRRELSAWMRGIGWTPAGYTKSVYMLRRLAVSATLNQHGIEWAAQMAGDNPETVRRYYGFLFRQQAPRVDTSAVILEGATRRT